MTEYKLFPSEATLEMGWAYLEAAEKSDPDTRHTFNHQGYRAMFADTPDLQGEPVAVVDADDDGMWADILPDVTVKVGQILYTAPQPAPDVDVLVDALEGLLGVIDESLGVSGYHLNGEIADWDEFQEVYDAIAALDTYRKGGE